MFLITSKYLIPKGYQGFTLYPFIFLRFATDKKNVVFVNHERIHLQQQLELLILPFYLWYFIEFFFRYLKYKNFDLAYRNISFEREAYAQEKNVEYLKSRKFWGFLKYVRGS